MELAQRLLNHQGEGDHLCGNLAFSYLSPVYLQFGLPNLPICHAERNGQSSERHSEQKYNL